MTKSRALSIASTYAAAQPGRIAKTQPVIQFCSADMGRRFGMAGDSWMITFDYVLPEGVYSTGGQLILSVDCASGTVTVAKLM